MAEGVRRISGADYGIATTGIAGPTGGSAEKPVGTVWFGIATPEGSCAVMRNSGTDRSQIIGRASAYAIEMLLAELTKRINQNYDTMIQSILDTDLYKFTTSYAYFKLYPEARGTFTFNDRAKTEYDEQFVDDLHDALDSLSRLSLTDEEFEYMIANCKYIPQNYFRMAQRLPLRVVEDRGKPRQRAAPAYRGN